MDDVIDLGARLQRKGRYLDELRRAVEESERMSQALEDLARDLVLASGTLPAAVDEALEAKADANVATLLSAARAIDDASRSLARLDVPPLAPLEAPSLSVVAPVEEPMESHPSLSRRSDDPFRRRARRQQARWREMRHLPPGTVRGETDLATLAMPISRTRLDNFISGPVRNMVRRYALSGAEVRRGYDRRFFADLLDTRALAFNLFGELARDTELATAVFRDRVRNLDRVLRVDLDYRPTEKRLGRVLHRDQRAPLHACVNYVTPDGELGFVGCVVLYAEPRPRRALELTDAERALLTELSTLRVDDAPMLERSRFSRLGRAYLTCGGLMHSDVGYQHGRLWAVFADDDLAAARTVDGFRELLQSQRSFDTWSLESFVRRVGSAGRRAWADAFSDRYLPDADGP